jgi:DNA-binding NarL/FixJ family response regulator
MTPQHDAQHKTWRTRVLLVDGEDIARIGLHTLLSRCAKFEVVGEAATGPEALRKAIALQPDVVITEARLRQSCGLALCRNIKAVAPGIKVLIFAAHHTDDLLRQSIAAGANGYALKCWRWEDVLTKLRKANSTSETSDPAEVRQLITRTREMTRRHVTNAFAQLSVQELRVLALLSEGKTNKSIAAALALGTGTVRNYVSIMLSKLNMRNRAEAAAYAAAHHVHEYI